MLLGFLGIGLGHGSFDFSARRTAAGLSHRTQDLIFLSLLVGFGIKAPMWPLHTWLPDAHTEAPTIGSVLLAGVLLKMGTYGLIRHRAARTSRWQPTTSRPTSACLAVIGIVYGSLVCLRPAQPQAAHRVLQRRPHGLRPARHLDADHHRHQRRAHRQRRPRPRSPACCSSWSARSRTATTPTSSTRSAAAPRPSCRASAACSASPPSPRSDCPGLAGFWGEMLALLGAYHPAAGLNRGLFLGLMTAGGIGAVLTASYLLWMLLRVNQGVVPPQWRAVRMPDVSLVELAVWTPLVVLTVAIGVYPRIVLGISAGGRLGAHRGVAMTLVSATQSRQPRRAAAGADRGRHRAARPGRRPVLGARPALAVRTPVACRCRSLRWCRRSRSPGPRRVRRSACRRAPAPTSRTGSRWRSRSSCWPRPWWCCCSGATSSPTRGCPRGSTTSSCWQALSAR